MINIIEKSKEQLRKTKQIFFDILKLTKNKRAFFIIFCPKNEKIKRIEPLLFNIIIDFLMFMRDYASNKIHLNRNQS